MIGESFVCCPVKDRVLQASPVYYAVGNLFAKYQRDRAPISFDLPAESLLETLLDARQRASVEAIRASAKILLTIVSDG